MQAIQHKLQTTHKGGRRSTGSSVAAPTNQDLVLHDRIGQGGFGICYKGQPLCFCGVGCGRLRIVSALVEE
jgi:hypothetical protein